MSPDTASPAILENLRRASTILAEMPQITGQQYQEYLQGIADQLAEASQQFNRLSVDRLRLTLQEVGERFGSLSVSFTKQAPYITNGDNQEIPVARLRDLNALSGSDDTLSFEECSEFLNHMTEFPTLCLAHPIGARIAKKISNLPKTSIEEAILYRVRRLEGRKVRPYVNAEMFEGPFTTTSQSRFSNVGQNYLYFSESLEVAKAECEIASEEKYCYIKAKLEVPKVVVDIRDRVDPLFAACHLPAENKHNSLKIEYLLPNFVSDCIKYNGSHGMISQSVHNTQVTNFTFFSCGKTDFHVIENKNNF